MPSLREEYTIELKNRFKVLQLETNDKCTNTSYNNFIKAHQEAAQNTIPIKPRKCKRVPWEGHTIEIQRKKVKESSQLRQAHPSLKNTTTLNKNKDELRQIYSAEMECYLQKKIDLIKNSSENNHSSLAWKTINKITGKKCTCQAKLKAPSQQGRLDL